MTLIRHDFLELTYEKIGFLVSRDQFFSSIYLEEDNEFTEYNGNKLFTFNLDKWLKNEFIFDSSNDLRLALICDIKNYSKLNRKRFNKVIENNPNISRQYISLKIGSQAEINSILLPEIKLIPGAMSNFQQRRGILGVRFKEVNFPQFLIDIEYFLFNSLFKEKILEL